MLCYVMKETTLLDTEESLFPKTKGENDPWKFIFRPDESKEIIIKDVDDMKRLVVLESPWEGRRERLMSVQGVKEKDIDDLLNSIPCAERSELTARVSVEKKVSFYPHPLTYNWSPFVLDSSKATLSERANNRFVLSASLPETSKNGTRILPLQTWLWTGPTASLDCRTPSTTASAQKARFLTKSCGKRAKTMGCHT